MKTERFSVLFSFDVKKKAEAMREMKIEKTSQVKKKQKTKTKKVTKPARKKRLRYEYEGRTYYADSDGWLSIKDIIEAETAAIVAERDSYIARWQAYRNIGAKVCIEHAQAPSGDFKAIFFDHGGLSEVLKVFKKPGDIVYVRVVGKEYSSDTRAINPEDEKKGPDGED